MRDCRCGTILRTEQSLIEKMKIKHKKRLIDFQLFKLNKSNEKIDE